VALTRPGRCLSTSSMSLSFEASGSLTSTTMTFQSVSPIEEERREGGGEIEGEDR